MFITTKQNEDIPYLLNSFCKKDINIQFEPKTRVNLSFKINIYASDTIDMKKKINVRKNKSSEQEKLKDKNDNLYEDYNN